MSELKDFINEYLNAISTQEKTEELLDKYISDSELKEHIRFFDTGFPGYQIFADDMIEEGNKVAIRATGRCVHKGELMGIPPTGKEINISLMLIYVVEDRKIVNHWMVVDQFSLMQQIGAIK